MSKLKYSPKFSQPMVAEITRWIGQNSVFSPEKEKLFRVWIEHEIASCRLAKFDKYTLSTMEGQMMRCVFLGMFLEKSIDDKQALYLDDVPQPQPIKER